MLLASRAEVVCVHANPAGSPTTAEPLMRAPEFCSFFQRTAASLLINIAALRQVKKDAQSVMRDVCKDLPASVTLPKL